MLIDCTVEIAAYARHSCVFPGIAGAQERVGPTFAHIRKDNVPVSEVGVLVQLRTQCFKRGYLIQALGLRCLRFRIFTRNDGQRRQDEWKEVVRKIGIEQQERLARHVEG